jgi:hypothetical protein
LTNKKNKKKKQIRMQKDEERCVAMKKDGNRCTRKPKVHDMCMQHAKVAENITTGSPKKTITITFGDVAENHARMQKIGEISDRGFTIQELEAAQQYFDDQGCNTEIVDLKKKLLESDKNLKVVDAKILIVRNALQHILGDVGKTIDDFFAEQLKLKWDKKALMRGKVVNKHARYNLCYSEVAQDPDYSNGKGTIVAFDQVPILTHVRNFFSQNHW